MIVYKEFASIERELGFSAKTLYGISNNIDKHYRKIRIPKRDGDFRTLSVPDEILKRVQRAIASKLLAYEPVSKYAKAYAVAVSVKKNAAPHVAKSKLLKLDIYKFFDSVLYSEVKEKVFPAYKYSEPIRILLSMLCYCGEVLPQGAPSSPAITNIIMRDFDELIGEWCHEREISYTRYCDDMTFSGDFDEGELVAFVSAELKKRGFILNERKTALAPSGKRQTVTGIVVNEKLNVARGYKREIRQELFFCRKYGVASHLARKSADIEPLKYLRGLLGRINYVLHVCPDSQEFKSYKSAVRDMIKITNK